MPELRRLAETTCAMSQRYKIRTFESGDFDGIVAAGTIVVPVDRSFSLHANSVDDAERTLQDEVAAGKLPAGRLYQICPPFGNAESIRAFSVSREGKAQRAYLDSASGIYSEFKRIRYDDLRLNAQREEVLVLQQA